MKNNKGISILEAIVALFIVSMATTYFYKTNQLSTKSIENTKRDWKITNTLNNFADYMLTMETDEIYQLILEKESIGERLGEFYSTESFSWVYLLKENDHRIGEVKIKLELIDDSNKVVTFNEIVSHVNIDYRKQKIKELQKRVLIFMNYTLKDKVLPYEYKKTSLWE
jgi:hypothetical protein